MRTDAILINSSGGNEMPKRMDRSKDSNEVSSPGFAMHNDGPKKASFDEVYKKVAQSNKHAKEKTDSSVQTFKESGVSEEMLRKLTSFISDQNNETEEDWEDIPPELKDDIDLVNFDETILQQFQQIQVIQELPVGQNVMKSGGEYAVEAAEVIIDAVAKIADILQINIAPGLDKLSLDTISQETIGQFVEIVSVLKNITEALDLTVEQGKPLDTGRTVLDVQSATEVASLLRSELFKIQLGLNMVGIGEEVEIETSRQLNVSIATGIPQASNPQDLSMPVEQITRIFGNLIENTSKGKETGTPSIVVVEAANEEVSGISIGKFDASTYRTLLKIEKNEEVAEKNGESAKSLDSLGFGVNVEPVIASDVNDLQKETENLPVFEISGKTDISSETASIESRIARALTKTTEESVMSQLSEKVKHLAGSGDTEIRIQLRPESLGEVKLAIRMEGDIVIARIQVENQQVKQIVESSLQTLKDALAEQNLQAGSFEVNVGSGWGRQSNQSSQQKMTSADNQHLLEGSAQEEQIEKMPSGFDTGHRYGNNSFEYYA